MTIDWWTLGLQAINVLILMWLLSRVFWRPVAAAISKRKDAVKAMLDAAKETQAKADAALAQVAAARDGITKERDTILSSAKCEADAATKAALSEAREKAEKIFAAEKASLARDTDTARIETTKQAAELSTEIAAKLLQRLSTSSIQEAFVSRLIEAITNMPESDRAALAQTTDGIDLVSASDIKAADKAKITTSVQKALGSTPTITFVTDTDLIAGMEIRTSHFVLHNSWQSDLAGILKELNNAAQ
ncbi:F0F1 ATP synthase subunit delta [Thalassospira alkalitolerans]|uniref:F0F1 ATP synthase subunit delta n=1 Tax=Thalassospira alkalitolerans TaxID=1293890 RepID=UPI003AA9B471|tara:strand:+ start:96158 stop:96898 length:741 start_codon:yes stop_codon:yes gene_type:complete